MTSRPVHHYLETDWIRLRGKILIGGFAPPSRPLPPALLRASPTQAVGPPRDALPSPPVPQCLFSPPRPSGPSTFLPIPACSRSSGGGLLAQSCPTLATPRSVARRAPLTVGILRARVLQWVATPSSWDPSDPGIESGSPALQAEALLIQPRGKPCFS